MFSGAAIEDSEISLFCTSSSTAMHGKGTKLSVVKIFYKETDFHKNNNYRYKNPFIFNTINFISRLSRIIFYENTLISKGIKFIYVWLCIGRVT